MARIFKTVLVVTGLLRLTLIKATELAYSYP